MARIWDWFMPRSPPIIAFIEATIIRRGFNWWVFINGKIRSAKGPNFCHVQRIRQFIQFIDDIVDGNQKWHGAAPSFNSNLIASMDWIRGWLLGLYINILEYNIIAEPRAWAKKYLIALSVSWLVWDCSISGINDNRLISMEIQAISQLVLAKAMIVLSIRNSVNNKEDGNINSTRVWRSWTPY
jgi:hypothetical protein